MPVARNSIRLALTIALPLCNGAGFDYAVDQKMRDATYSRSRSPRRVTDRSLNLRLFARDAKAGLGMGQPAHFWQQTGTNAHKLLKHKGNFGGI